MEVIEIDINAYVKVCVINSFVFGDPFHTLLMNVTLASTRRKPNENSMIKKNGIFT